MHLFTRIKNKINQLQRERINHQLQEKLKNRSLSLLSSNCNGAFILHDLNLPFASPFVNLYLTPKDFIKYLQNIALYQPMELGFVSTDNAYPVGRLVDINLHFMHYESEQQAREKWVARSARINFNNLFIMMAERDGCTYEDLQAFDNLPFKNKVVFTHQPYPELSSAFHIKGFEQAGEVGDLFAYSDFSGKKYYDQFDYVQWFNTAFHQENDISPTENDRENDRENNRENDSIDDQME